MSATLRGSCPYLPNCLNSNRLAQNYVIDLAIQQDFEIFALCIYLHMRVWIELCLPLLYFLCYKLDPVEL